MAGKVASLDLIVVKEDVSRKAMSYILEHIASFPGVEIPKNYLRAYPQGSLAAHLLGNMGEITKEQLKEQRFKGYSAGDMVGQGGLEWSYDRWLRGRDGVAKVEVDALGRPKQHAPVPGGRLPEPGDTLVTTLDAKVQAKAEEALQYGIHLAVTGGQVDANGGAAVVLDARNGEVVAMASYPTFDPNVWVGGISTKDYKKLKDPHANYAAAQPRHPGAEGGGLHVQGDRRHRGARRGRHHAVHDLLLQRQLQARRTQRTITSSAVGCSAATAPSTWCRPSPSPATSTSTTSATCSISARAPSSKTGRCASA